MQPFSGAVPIMNGKTLAAGEANSTRDLRRYGLRIGS